MGWVSCLGGLFAVYWTIPILDLLEEFLHTWESKEYGWIWAIICDEKITIDQMLIMKQFGVNVKGMVDAVNMLVKEAQMALLNIVGLDAFVNKE